MGRAFEYRKERKFARWGAMAKVFTRVGKEIIIAIKEGGTDPNYNPRLRAAIQNGKRANMPKTNIENAIKRATSKDTENYSEVVYEGYAAHGIAVLVETSTDNPTRTVANVRSYFNKCGGSLGTSGSVDYLFERKGLFRVKKEAIPDVEEMEFELIDFGLDSIKVDEEEVVIYCAFTEFGTMQKALEDRNIEIQESQLERIPTMTKKLSDDDVELVIKLIDKLEEDDDVNQVFTTMDMSE